MTRRKPSDQPPARGTDPGASQASGGDPAQPSGEALGKVWLVGAGPGDPDLITLRGREVLAAADVVLFDALSHPALLSWAPQAEIRAVGKRGGTVSPEQTWITEQLIELARAGKRVVRLKGGDPSLFARGAEEALALHDAGVPFEIVPGVASPIAAAAFAGLPLTHRELSSSVTFITGTDRFGRAWTPQAWARLATSTETLCVLMGMRNLRAIADALMAGGRSADCPAAAVQWAGRPSQRSVTSTLGKIAEAVERSGLSNPAIVVIGEVVRLQPRLAWYERQPLFGRRVAVPRPPHQAGPTAAALRRRGAEPCLFPAIEIIDPPEPERLTQAALELERYQWCVFTSTNGVDRFFAALRAAGRDARAFGRCRLAAIGPKTGAALEPHGLRADLVARQFVGEALARDLIAQGGRGRVLIPRALVAREHLPQALSAAGFEVDVVPAYETRALAGERRGALRLAIDRGQLDAILFTSSSMVDSVVEMLGLDAAAQLGRILVASIGPITTATAERHGLRVDVTASVYTVAGLLDAMERHLAAQSGG